LSIYSLFILLDLLVFHLVLLIPLEAPPTCRPDLSEPGFLPTGSEKALLGDVRQSSRMACWAPEFDESLLGDMRRSWRRTLLLGAGTSRPSAMQHPGWEATLWRGRLATGMDGGIARWECSAPPPDGGAWRGRGPGRRSRNAIVHQAIGHEREEGIFFSF